MAIRYVTYKRVSTKEQSKSGLGLEAQDRDIRLFLQNFADEPWEIVGEFLDIGSGNADDRPELAKAVALAKETNAILLVSKLDRLSRRVSTIAKLMEDKKPEFRVASMPTADNFQLHIYAALAEQERKFISRRTKEALKAAKARGVRLGGLRDKTMKRNEALKKQANDNAQKLKGIVMPLKERGDSYRKIAYALNEANVASPRQGTWHPNSVRRMVQRIEAQ